MIRFTLLWLFVVTVSVYAWKDWFKALCGLILMMAVIQHPDMPKSLAGIQGLNPWNVVLASTMGAWLVARQREGSQWDIPRHIAVLFVLYMGVAFIAFVRMMLDSDALHEPMGYLVGEHLINVFKWVIPGIMLFDGCRTRARFKWAIFSVLALYFLLAVQVIRWVPLEYAMEGDKLQARSHKVIAREIGYHRVNMSMMLAGASWAIFVVGATARSWSPRLLLLAASLVVVFGQSLTAGRAGYGTWAVIGLLLCLVRWKRYLFLAPVVALGLVSFVPGVSERMSAGFSEETHDSNQLVQEAMNTRGTGSTRRIGIRNRSIYSHFRARICVALCNREDRGKSHRRLRQRSDEANRPDGLLDGGIRRRVSSPAQRLPRTAARYWICWLCDRRTVFPAGPVPRVFAVPGLAQPGVRVDRRDHLCARAGIVGRRHGQPIILSTRRIGWHVGGDRTDVSCSGGTASRPGIDDGANQRCHSYLGSRSLSPAPTDRPCQWTSENSSIEQRGRHCPHADRRSGCQTLENGRMTRIVYILAASHSGSTLLAMLLGRHPELWYCRGAQSDSVG